MMLSQMLVDSLRNYFETCSPKRTMIGARSVAKLFVKSSHSLADSTAVVAGTKEAQSKRTGNIIWGSCGETDAEK